MLAQIHNEQISIPCLLPTEYLHLLDLIWKLCLYWYYSYLMACCGLTTKITQTVGRETIEFYIGVLANVEQAQIAANSQCKIDIRA